MLRVPVLLLCCVLGLLVPVYCNLEHSLVLEPHSKFTLQWEVYKDEITFAVEADCKCWLGIGWHNPNGTEGQMIQTDIVVASFDLNGTLVSVTDRRGLTNNMYPSEDTTMEGGRDDILEYSGFQTEKHTFFQFKRKLDTQDTVGDFPIVVGKTSIIWAHGDVTNTKYAPGDFHYHGNNPLNRGSVVVDLTSGEVAQSSTNLPAWHGSMMTIAWGFCLSFGLFNARYLKYYYWWFPLHIITQVSGVLIAIAAFVIAIKMTSGQHFNTLHSLFGITVMGLSMLAVTMGTASHYLYDPRRSVIPWWPDKGHWWVGRAAILLSYATIILGMLQYGTPLVMVYAFSVLVALYFFIYTYLDIYRWKEKQEGTTLDVHS